MENIFVLMPGKRVVKPDPLHAEAVFEIHAEFQMASYVQVCPGVDIQARPDSSVQGIAGLFIDFSAGEQPR